MTPLRQILVILALASATLASTLFLFENTSTAPTSQASHLTSCVSIGTSGISVDRISSPVLYTDYPPGIVHTLNSMYVGYKITNNSGAAYSDLWAELDEFTGSDIGLAADEDGRTHIGPLGTGESTMIFNYLTVSDPGGGTVGGDHEVVLYTTRPDLASSALCDTPFSYTAENTIKAAANKVNTYVVGPDPAELGGIMTMTVCGDTGTIGAAEIFATTPATAPTWPANSYQLIDAKVTFDVGGTDTVVHDTLFLDASSPQPPIAGPYCSEFTFIASGSTVSPTNISPVNFISSGTQVKHTSNTDDFVDDPITFPPITPTTNSVVIGSKSASPTNLPTGGDTTYTITVQNNGTITTTLDDFTDILPTSPGIAVYKTGSATFDGVAIPDPAITGTNNEILTFLGTFEIPPSGGTKVLEYEATLPITSGSYSNSAVAHVSTTQIDTTATLGDNSPAVTTVTIGAPPQTDLSLTKTDSADPILTTSALTYSLQVSNTGPDPSTGSTITDTLPANTTFNNALSSPACNEPATGTVQCVVGAIGVGSSTNFSIVVNLDPSLAGSTINNTATVVANDDDSNTSNNTATETTNVEAPVTPSYDLTVTKTPSTTTATFDEQIVYTISYTNTGTVDQTGVTISETVPANTTFAAASSTTGWSCADGSGAGTSCTLAVGAVAAGASGTATFAVQTNGYDEGVFETVENTGTIADDGTSGYTDSNTSNNTSTASTSIEYTNVFDPPSAVKTFNDQGIPEIEWKMVWINDGNTTALNVQVVDPVPPGTTYVNNSVDCDARGNSTTTRCEYVEAENRVIWEGAIAPDQNGTTEENSDNEVVIVFKTTVLPGYTEVANQAVAYWDNNGDGNVQDDIDAGQEPVKTDDPLTTASGDASQVKIPQKLPQAGYNTLMVVLVLAIILLIATATVLWNMQMQRIAASRTRASRKTTRHTPKKSTPTRKKSPTTKTTKKSLSTTKKKSTSRKKRKTSAKKDS